MKIAVIGLGLLGGSFALEFRALGYKIYGVEANEVHAAEALALGLVDEIVTLEKITEMNVVLLAVPVDVLDDLVITVLDLVTNNTLVFDVGSTKESVCNAVRNHSKRANFVAMHPIAGTEFSGPQAAFQGLFKGKVTIICEQKLSNKKLLDKLLKLLKPLEMRIEYMESSAKHDMHIAYVSHLSHVSSFMLGKTVLEIEKSEKSIFDMAGSGFESTVRLAKSSPKTWTPIFLQNKKHIINALDEYITNLENFKTLIKDEKSTEIHAVMQETNYIKTILDN